MRDEATQSGQRQISDDGEAPPVGDGQFDTTVTMFGAMFAYRLERAATERLHDVASDGATTVVSEYLGIRRGTGSVR
jgi:hypothetical protein